MAEDRPVIHPVILARWGWGRRAGEEGKEGEGRRKGRGKAEGEREVYGEKERGRGRGMVGLDITGHQDTHTQKKKKSFDYHFYHKTF